MALTSVELQVISKILTTDNKSEAEELLKLDSSYYSIFGEQIEFIQKHYEKYGKTPDLFTFQSEFPEFEIVATEEPLEYLLPEMSRNKQRIMLVKTFDKINNWKSNDISKAWEYVQKECEEALALRAQSEPMDIIKEADKRAEQIIEFSKQKRIPTGFEEIDEIMYGGLSTVEELMIIVARTNTGKSWVGTKMMETAQKNGFPVLYYSPEMQASYLGTRVDTWRKHFENNKIYQGKYNDEYIEYIQELKGEETSAYILENKDAPNSEVTVDYLKTFAKQHDIKLLIVDGMSYLTDSKANAYTKEYEKYQDLSADLFALSKECGCAVVVMVQANRDTQNTKDDKGEVFPSLYNVANSDAPARIATTAISMRQIFDRHVLDIRIEKSRYANNRNQEFEYSWDINTGNMQYVPSEDDIEDVGVSISGDDIDLDDDIEF